MGYSCSWVAVQGADKDEVMAFLGLAETGRPGSPNSRQSDFCWKMLSGDWFLLFSEDYDYVTRERVVELSRFGWAVGGKAEDRFEMGCAVSSAKDGVEAWSVYHENDETGRRLDVTGEPPAEFAALRDAAFAEQDELDAEDEGVDVVFDVPADLMKAVTGYRYDEDFDGFMDVRRVRDVYPPRAPATGFLGALRRLFGGD